MALENYGEHFFATELISIDYGEARAHARALARQRGYDIRAALQSLLCQDNVDDHDQSVSVDALVDAFHNWNAEFWKPVKVPSFFAYSLGEDYGDNDFSEDFRLSNLRERDLKIGLALQKVCDATGGALFLSSIERNIEEVEPDEEDEEHAFSECSLQREPVHSFSRIVDLDGDLCAQGCPASATDLIQDDYFNDYREGEEGFMQVLVVAPDRWRFFETLMNRDKSLNDPIIGYLYQKHQQHPDRDTDRSQLLSLRTKVIEEKEVELRMYTTPVYHHEALVRATKVCAQLNELDLLQRALRCFVGGAPPEFFEDLRDMLKSVPFVDLIEGFNTCIEHFSTFKYRFEALQKLGIEQILTSTNISRESDREMRAWVTSKMEELLDAPKILIAAGRLPVMHFSMLMGGDEYLLDKICPILESATELTPFVIVFLVFLHESNLVSKATVATVFGRVVPCIIDHFSLVRWEKPAYKDYMTNKISLRDPNLHGSQGGILLTPINGHDLAEFMDVCIQLGLRDCFDRLFSEVGEEAPRLDLQNLKPVILYYLQDLIPILSKHKLPLDTPRQQSVYQNVLNYFCNEYVGREPEKPPPTWCRQPVVCPHRRPCGDCDQLNGFLLDPTHRDYEWKIYKYRHDEVRKALQKAGADCTATTTGRGSTYHLLLRKTTDSWDKAFQSWDARRREAQAILAGFDSDALKVLLGDRYEEITSMEHLQLPPRVELPGPMPALPAQSTHLSNRMGPALPYPSQPPQEQYARNRSFATDNTGSTYLQQLNLGSNLRNPVVEQSARNHYTPTEPQQEFTNFQSYHRTSPRPLQSINMNTVQHTTNSATRDLLTSETKKRKATSSDIIDLTDEGNASKRTRTESC